MKILRVIDRGGFGRVEKIQKANGDILARKVFDPTAEILKEAGREKLIKRFKREVRVQSNLDSDYFIPIIEFDLDAAEPLFIMPFAEKNLMDEINECKKSGTVPKEALADTLNSLEKLHSLGYTHRDLKPHNILLHEGRWKLSDFGLITPLIGSTTTLTSINSAWGSVFYCAPEQVVNFKQATPQSDIYSFGCILHDIFGEPTRIPYHKHNCKGSVSPIIEKCTEIESRKRFKNISSLRGALLTILANPTVIILSQTTEEWLIELNKLDAWDDDEFNDFTRFLTALENHEDRYAVFTAIDEDKLKIFFEKNNELALTIALEYCEWAQGTFEFSYCDVIIRRLEYIFQLGNMDCKAASVISAAELGSSHNRWFVMGRVLSMCNKTIDDRLAERIVIEILAEEKQREFKRCAEEIKLSINDYHDTIAKSLCA